MPESNEENSLQTVEDSAPVAVNTYMTPGGRDSVTILPDFAENAVEEFKRERLELEQVDDTPEPTAKAEFDLTTALGGPEAVQALAEVLNNPDADLTHILPAKAIESVVWAALENPVTQQTVLSDPEVRSAISRELLNGYSIEDIQQLLSQYGPGTFPDPEVYAEQLRESEQRVQQFQHDFFVSPVDETLKDMGIDAGRVEEISDALTIAQARFLRNHHDEYLRVQSLVESGLASQARLPQARLANAWQGTLLKQLEKLKSASTSATKKSATKEVESDKPVTAEAYDLLDPNWITRFTDEFRQERKARGL